MSKKKLPMTSTQLLSFAEEYETPMYIYDEKGIREGLRRFTKAFSWAPNFKEYFAVKACPTPGIIEILKEEGAGLDCSSMAELIIAERLGFEKEDILFTSNETPIQEYKKAIELGAIINLDDITHIDYIHNSLKLPDFVAFRYNPGEARSGNSIIGDPKEAKYGLTKEQLFAGYEKLKQYGVTRFGLHTMIASNELKIEYFIETARMIFNLVKEIKEKTGCEIEFVDLGGGIGIPYHPDEKPVNLEELGQEIKSLYETILQSQGIELKRLAFECGRVITGPYGFLLTKAIHSKNTYKNYIGVDACMANLMRPGIYGAYHHITVAGKEEQSPQCTYDIVGSLCENSDKFAINRQLPSIDIGDLLVIHDAGAHGYSMGFQYNGKLRCPEFLLEEKTGQLKMIRRGETLEDYFATFIW